MELQTHTREIEQMIEGVNDAWLHERFDDMDQYFHHQVVLVDPGSTNKVTGRDAMIDSYREFMDQAQVDDFKINDFIINVFDTTAVAQYTFLIKYSVDSTKYIEEGVETLVFHHHNHRWVIVWRSQQPGD